MNLTQERLNELKQAVSSVYFIAFAKISDPETRKSMVNDGEDLLRAIHMAEHILAFEWAITVECHRCPLNSDCQIAVEDGCLQLCTDLFANADKWIDAYHDHRRKRNDSKSK